MSQLLWCPADLQEQWARYLSFFPWDFFCTLTFKRPVSNSDIAFRRVKKWSRYWGFVRALYCAERFTRTNDVHIHGLIAMPEAPRKQTAIELWNDWFRRYGICRISALSSTKSKSPVALYVAKYCTKGVDSFEYLLWGARSQWKNLVSLVGSGEQSIEKRKEMLAKSENHGIIEVKGSTDAVQCRRLPEVQRAVASPFPDALRTVLRNGPRLVDSGNSNGDSNRLVDNKGHDDGSGIGHGTGDRR